MKKFLVTLLVAMLALTAVALADVYEVETWYEHLNKYHQGQVQFTKTDDPWDVEVKQNIPDLSAFQFELPTCEETGICYHPAGDDDDNHVGARIFHLIELGHKWEYKNIEEGDCTTNSSLTQVCVRKWKNNGSAKCGETKTSPVPGTHSYGIVTVQKRTCVDALITYEGCVACGQPKGEKLLKTWWPGLGDAEDLTKTKVIDGVTYYYGGKNYAPYDLPNTTDKNEAETNPDTVHKLLSGWVVTEEPTCTTMGHAYRACPYCGYEELQLIPAIGHSFERECEHTNHLHPLKTANANISNCLTVALYYNYIACEHEGCDAIQLQDKSEKAGFESKYAKDSGNDPVVNAYNAIKPLYKADVLAKIYYYKYTQSVHGTTDPVYGHHIADESKTVYTVDKASTCVVPGEFTQITLCSVCKDIVPELTTENKGGNMKRALPLAKHTYGDWEHLFDASEDTNFVSYWRRQCSVCLRYETSVEGPCGKYNHTAAAPVKENVVKATFTAAGSYEEVVYCSVCKIELSREEKVEAMLEGLNPADGKIWDDGKAIEGTGMVEFNGGKFYVVDGVLQNAMGVTNVGGKFLFLAHGQLQEVTQLAEYDGEWFYVVDGEVQVGFNGLVEYDGAKFLVGAGRVQFEQTTLFNDGTQWVLISAGQVATSYTGAFTYDGVVFQVVNGIVK